MTMTYAGINGAGGGGQFPSFDSLLEAPATPQRKPKSKTPDEIVKMVDAKRLTLQSLRERMDEDYRKHWLLEPFVELDPDGNAAAEGFRSFTTNEPRVYADKMNAWLSASELIVTMLHRSGTEHQQDEDHHKERWIIGVLASANERLRNMGMLELHDALPWFANVRGWNIGRSLLRKDSEGRTIVDVTPWDPRNCVWDWGEDGLNWACHVTFKTRGEIKAMFGMDLPQSEDKVGKTNPSEELLKTYDYYDRDYNCVIVEVGDNEHSPVKQSEVHGSPRTPVYCSFVATQPVIEMEETAGDRNESMRYVGESVWDKVRTLYESYNTILSVLTELTARMREQPYIVESADGRRTLDANPWKTASEIPLKQGEKISLLDQIESTKDLQMTAQLVQGELQRGSIPYAAYGELAFQLSGFAITQLKEGIESALMPRLKCMKSSYMQITQLLTDQYETGAFEPVSVSGRDRGRAYFDEEIDPSQLAEACDFDIELVGQVPQDDAAKMNLANLARQPVNGRPLLPDKFIRADLLKIPNADVLEDQLGVQVGEQMLPEAGLFSVMRNTEDQGDTMLASFMYQQLMITHVQKQMELMQLQMQMQMMQQGIQPPGGMPGMGGGGPGGDGQGAPPGPGGLPSQVMPDAMNGGAPQPPGVEQLGGMVAPGQPRPGAQQQGGM